MKRASGVLVFLLACGGGTASEPETTETTGDEEVARPEVLEEAPVEEELVEEEEAPGEVRIALRVGNAPATGTVQLLDTSGAVAAEGASGDALTVPSGEYRVVATLADGQLAGAMPRQDNLYVEPGANERTLTWEVTRVTFVVRRRGQPVGRWRIVAQREGGQELVFEPSEEPRVVMPGRYTAVLTFGAQRVEVNGLIFQGGATQTVPIDVN
ncbi:MAG: hypothetical protein KC586_27120 [Myxococcales bacterium]|nr:hypothetical protein [Myxococcales bacterium]